MKKLLIPIGILVIVIVVIGIFATRGIKGPEERPATTTPTQEKATPGAEEGTLEDCIRGYEFLPEHQRGDPQMYIACAIKYKNPQVCERMKLAFGLGQKQEVKDGCYAIYAVATKDISACDKISSEEEKESCREGVQSMP